VKPRQPPPTFDARLSPPASDGASRSLPARVSSRIIGARRADIEAQRGPPERRASAASGACLRTSSTRPTCRRWPGCTGRSTTAPSGSASTRGTAARHRQGACPANALTVLLARPPDPSRSIWLVSVEQISKAYPKADPIKILLHKLFRLLSAPLAPLFVFDGPLRPSHKRGKEIDTRAPVVNERRFRDMAAALGFACWTAPGEAEAELSFLASQGRLDAVITEDSDAMLFGAPLVLSKPRTCVTSCRSNRMLCLANPYAYASSAAVRRNCRPTTSRSTAWRRSKSGTRSTARGSSLSA
jgi:hypothetical protein